MTVEEVHPVPLTCPICRSGQGQYQGFLIDAFGTSVLGKLEVFEEEEADLV